MVGTRTFWRSFAGAMGVAAATSIAAVATGGGFWTTLAIGAAAASALAWSIARSPFEQASTSTAEAGQAVDAGDARVEHNPRVPDLALLGTVLETMIEGVMVVDAREHLVYANPAARVLLEISPRVPADRPLLESVRSPGIEATMQKALECGATQHSEFQLPRKDRVLALTASPLAGQPEPGVVLVLHDVTDLRRLERMRREFVSNVSHELKTPLTHIQAYADTLADGAIDDQEHSRKFLERIIEQAERLQMLIADLLRLAQIESQEEEVELEPLELVEATERCVEEHRAAAQSGEINLMTDYQDNPYVMADVAGLQQIVDNLVDNALKYTPAGGDVRVSVLRDGDWAKLEVSDTGIGISRDEQPRVFERFYRVDRARARTVGGTGLGLAIVKHLVQSYAGTISLHSELGKGSRFVVRLPAIAPDATDDADRK